MIIANELQKAILGHLNFMIYRMSIYNWPITDVVASCLFVDIVL